MVLAPSSSTQRRLRQELRSRWLAGERTALRGMLDALPLEQRQPALNVLLPEELSLRQQAGETLERAVLEATYPEAGDWLDQLLEDAVTIREPGSGGPWALTNSWPQTTSTMTADGGRPED